MIGFQNLTYNVRRLMTGAIAAELGWIPLEAFWKAAMSGQKGAALAGCPHSKIAINPPIRAGARSRGKTALFEGGVALSPVRKRGIQPPAMPVRQTRRAVLLTGTLKLLMGDNNALQREVVCRTKFKQGQFITLRAC